LGEGTAPEDDDDEEAPEDDEAAFADGDGTPADDDVDPPDLGVVCDGLVTGLLFADALAEADGAAFTAFVSGTDGDAGAFVEAEEVPLVLTNARRDSIEAWFALKNIATATNAPTPPTMTASRVAIWRARLNRWASRFCVWLTRNPRGLRSLMWPRPRRATAR